MYKDCCLLLLYLKMSTYEYYWCRWCCCNYRNVRPLLGSRELCRQYLTLVLLSWIVQRLVCHGCVCFCSFFCHFFCSCVAVWALFSLAPLLYPRLYLTVCIQLNSTYADCCSCCCCTCCNLRGLLLLSVPMTCIVLGCCCCCSSSIDY